MRARYPRLHARKLLGDVEGLRCPQRIAQFTGSGRRFNLRLSAMLWQSGDNPQSPGSAGHPYGLFYVRASHGNIRTAPAVIYVVSAIHTARFPARVDVDGAIGRYAPNRRQNLALIE
jgi:hypothetical protein